ncbi:glyoxalase [Actinorhabdospora filicis]|uniref:Glyoxalase n=1 Tax=Actinorhabdospora filicis TaxID=1785913 RepID=A0A9W6WC91_9ACTN|nr:VOC family protein [Actinorhabdospora filicis]GLZ80361.1 glyoxalase [Actinorhabdospora filicis]
MRVSDIVIDCPDPAALARFYSGLLSGPTTGGIAGEIVREEDDWVTVDLGGGPRLAFQLAPGHVPPAWPDPSRPQQFHLDLEVDDIDEARALAETLGARFVEEHVGERGYGFVVMIDPAGHPFCLCRTE